MTDRQRLHFRQRLSRHPMTWVSLFWFGLGLLYVPQQLIMAAVRGASDSDPVIVLSNFGIWIIWAAFTPIVWRITRHWPIREGRLARHLGVHACRRCCWQPSIWS